ncbi:uncharacterized protein [Apostichopus japonicus]|uniref:uncharacterized protein isoform X2 n=1 Tax=Stichopus japonicus TaxID=307972 RepID=UPI003AB7B852
MKSAKRTIVSTSVIKSEGEMTKSNLDQYRSPSMWEKLEKWKTEKKMRQTSIKASTKKPFKAGSTSMQQNKGKVPSKASEKMKLLVESNLKTSWSYNTSPRHLNYRKTLASARRTPQQTDKRMNGKENRKSVRKSTNRRETLTLSTGKVKMDSRSKRDSKIVSQEVSKNDTSNARRETLTLSTGKKLNTQHEKQERDLKDEDEENDLRRELQVQRRAAKKRSANTLGGEQSGKKMNSVAERKDRRMTRERPWRQSKVTNGGLGEERKLRAESHKWLHKTSLTKPSVHERPSTSQEGTQESIREKLEQWLIAKGKTPKRAAKFMKTPKVTTRSRMSLEEDEEATSLDNVLTVDEAMDACKNLLNEGCPAEYLFDWLTNIETKLPYLSDMESFLECRKTVQEAFNGQSIDEIIPEAIMDETKEVSIETVPGPPATPTPRKPRRSCYQLLSPLGEHEESSAVKYQVRDATPYFKRIQQALGRTSDTPSTMIITPVRRSVRLSKRKSVSFASRERGEVDMCVSNLREIEDLPLEEPVQLVLRSNRALEEEFDLNDEEMSI